MFHLRPATQEDFPAIRSLIHLTKINPLGLRWQRFWVAVDKEERMIGCGQVKPHRDGSLELASIAVIPGCRRMGVASAIIRRLMEMHSGRLYLTCRASLGSFYAQFGFRVVGEDEMPPYFHRIYRLVKLFSRTTPGHEGLLVMVGGKSVPINRPR